MWYYGTRISRIYKDYMSKFTCKCGNLLSTSQCPNDIELRVFTDREYDKILKLDSVYDIPLPKHDWWRCPHCERIYVFYEDKLIKTYALENK